MKRAFLIGVLLAGCGGGSDEVCSVPGPGPGFDPTGPMCTHLSSYHLFDDIHAQTPAAGLLPYDLNTPLFSDYTTKFRYVFIPDGKQATWQDPGVLDLPVGSMLVKTFTYLDDLRDPSKGKDLLETRVLLHRDSGWEGASYVYDADDQEADLDVAGVTVHASWIDKTGATQANDWEVPNKNQCKNCHEDMIGTFEPLGPKVRHINRTAPDVAKNQLQELIDRGALTGAPTDASTWPKAPVFDDPATGTVEERARAYLDINCSHCHNPSGAARTSGLDLRAANTDLFSLGVCKPPVAAGRGSGGLQYAIVPGDPDMSFLVFRLSSVDPEIRMPELGRNLVHAEGVQLIRDWITGMTPTGCTPAPP